MKTKLTPIQLEILTLATRDGAPDKEIADRLGKHINTIQHHWRRMAAVYGVKTRFETIIKTAAIWFPLCSGHNSEPVAGCVMLRENEN